MKTLLKWLAAVVIVVAAFASLGTLVPRPLTSPAAASAGSGSQILLLANPIHTDIALPLDDEVRAAFADLIPAGLPIDMPGVEYLIIGWGGRSFYIDTPTWGDIRPLPVLKALTVDRSVLHASVAAAIDPSHPAVRPLDVTGEGRSRMIAAIRASFVRENGEPVPIPGRLTGLTMPFSRRKDHSTRLSAATPGRRPCCAAPGSGPAGGRPCRKCWNFPSTFITAPEGAEWPSLALVVALPIP